MNTKTILLFALYIIVIGIPIHGEETINGTYVIQDAVENYQGTRFFKISRNKYQEYELSVDTAFQGIAYYDKEGQELFCVFTSAHQYSTLLKVVVKEGLLRVYSLENNIWREYPGTYRKKTS
ncbi:MAG: hypothetical protein JW875_09485 [Spirochaetales bacterium]|nr:hypothetical protein [Spirochaetales bacterium]